MRNGWMKCNVFDFDHAFGKNMIDVNLLGEWKHISTGSQGSFLFLLTS